MSRVDHDEWDAILRTLAHGDRRQIVQYVRSKDGPVSLDEVVDHLVEGSEGDSDAELASVRANLYHVHLPKLSDAGLVSWEGGEKVAPRTLSKELSGELVSPPPTLAGGLGEADD